VDSIVTDPPYGLGFMGKAWDALPPGLPWAQECLRVLKPGGHLLAFGGTRTWHRLAVAVEDAGFEIRDSIAWLYGSGFPKSLDVSKAIDKAAGAERGKVRLPVAATAYSSNAGNTRPWMVEAAANGYREVANESAITDAARTWQGWGTALKPAFEPVVVGRKPLDGTVAANVLTHGTGALNIDGCRIASGEALVRPSIIRTDNDVLGKGLGAGVQVEPSGRWPTNVVLDESQAGALDQQTGILTSGANPTRRGSDTFRNTYGEFTGQEECTPARGADQGGASRFFPIFRYEAKAGSAERPTIDGTAHPTVKPLDLMRWLVRLVTPSGGVVLEPFAGSGTTAEACVIEGMRCIAIEREGSYLPLITSRLAKPIQPVMFGENGGKQL
jgi:site-specific DNA-methyltransferase (adenine-specific)